VLVAAFVFAIIGPVAVIGLAPWDTGPHPPTVLSGRVDLGFEPEVVGASSSQQLAFANGTTLIRLDVLSGHELWMSKTETSDPVRAIASVPGPVLLSTMEIIDFGAFDTPERAVALPTACCRDLILEWAWHEVLVFPEEDGRSAALWRIDLDDGTSTSYPLPTPIEIVAVVQLDGVLFVAHPGGVLALAPWWGCTHPLASWDIPMAALTTTRDPDAVVGLDAQNGVIYTFDARGSGEGTLPCARVPVLTGAIPVREAGPAGKELQATLAVVDHAAYVVDTAGVVSVVDLSRPAEMRGDRLLASIAIPEPRPTAGARLLVDSSRGEANVFLTVPDHASLWWIGRDPAPDEVIIPDDS